MQNNELIVNIIQYLKLSNMDEKENDMWMKMLPFMETEQLEKLQASLKKEADTLTNLYLNLAQK